MNTPSIVSNRSFIDNDTSEIVDKYIDEICSDPEFLCKNVELCGTNTSIYTNVKNVESICNDIKESNKCENDIKQCVILSKNTFDESQTYVSTSFVNIIVPIKDAIDPDGNQKFLRLPPLSASKKENSNEICSVCACMNRFAHSPGSGTDNNTSPGQNECVYPENFEYFYYPLYIENINGNVPNAPPVKLGNYNVLNKNIIYANTGDDLTITNLYDILINNGIKDSLTQNFLLNILYPKNSKLADQLSLYLKNKDTMSFLQGEKYKSYKNLSFFYSVFIVLVLFYFFVIKV